MTAAIEELTAVSHRPAASKDFKSSSIKIDFRAWAQDLRDSSDYEAPDTSAFYPSDMSNERALWEN
eukprot:765646-Hanusia_phi.AAC.1